jgi:hypothetical protein
VAVLRAASRIAVIGCPGAGKTTFTTGLSAATGHPTIHLDDAYWLPDWQRPDPSEWRATQTALASGERWIIDGNYEADIDIRARRADVVILVHRGRLTCLLRVLRRRRAIGAGRLEALPLAIRAQAAAQTTVRAHGDLGKLVRTIVNYRPARCLRVAKSAVVPAERPDVIVVASRLPHPLIRRVNRNLRAASAPIVVPRVALERALAASSWEKESVS